MPLPALAIGFALLDNPSLLILGEALKSLVPMIVRKTWEVLAAVRVAGVGTPIVGRGRRTVLCGADRAVVLEKA